MYIVDAIGKVCFISLKCHRLLISKSGNKITLGKRRKHVNYKYSVSLPVHILHACMKTQTACKCDIDQHKFEDADPLSHSYYSRKHLLYFMWSPFPLTVFPCSTVFLIITDVTGWEPFFTLQLLQFMLSHDGIL